jgi:hypothetical protein
VFGTLGVDIRNTLESFRRDIDRLFSRDSEVPIGITEAIVAKAEEILARRTLKAQIGDVSATLATEQIVRASQDNALAASITSLQSDVGDVSAALVTEQTTRATADSALSSDVTAVQALAELGSASGLVKLEATTTPEGVTARFGTYLRATTGSGFNAQAAEYLEIVNGTTRKVIAAAQTVIADAGGNVLSLFDANGQFINNARIVNLTADNIAAGAVTADKIAVGSLTATQINTSSLILGDLNLSKGGFTYSRIVRNSGDDASCGLQDANSLNHTWYLIQLRVNITDASGGGGSGTAQTWRIQIYWPGGNTELESFSSINGVTKNFFFTLFIDRQQYSNLGNGYATVQVERTGPNAGGSRNNASWLILSGFQQG